MKKLQKIEIINLIGRELQDRMKFVEIDGYFESYGIPTNHQPTYNSKYVYVQEVLPKVKDEIILEMASELGLEHPAVSQIPIIKENEATFWKPGHFKLFISHLASFKKTIGILQTRFSASIHRGATGQTGSGARGSLELSRVPRSWRTGTTQYDL